MTLFADRTATSMMESNPLCLYCSTVSNTLMVTIKVIGLQDTAMTKAQALSECGCLQAVAVSRAYAYPRSPSRHLCSFAQDGEIFLVDEQSIAAVTCNFPCDSQSTSTSMAEATVP